MLVIGHRGASAFAPENTLASFKKAIELGADGFECDVRLSKDKKLVVIHDADVKKASGKKDSRLVSELTARQMAKYGIPTLQQVIDLKKQHPKLLIIIELKEPNTEEQIVEIVKKSGIVKQVILVSFSSSAVNKVKQLFKPDKVKTGFIFAKTTPRPFPIALGIKADWIVPLNTLIDSEMVENAHKHGIKVLAWTVEQPFIAKRLEELGIDAVASNSLLNKTD